METVFSNLYKERIGHPDTLGILIIEETDQMELIKYSFDVIILIIVENLHPSWLVKHYYIHNKKTGIFTFSDKCINDQLFAASNRHILEWFLSGETKYERDDYVKKIKTRLIEFPVEDREKKIGIEFAKFIVQFSEGKQLFASNQYLDAFHHILKALHHLARIAVLEYGLYPEVTVWDQVKKIKPEIYKLYAELIGSQEPLEKRIELLLLAHSVSLNMNAEIGGRHLLKVMKTKDTFWPISEIMNHPDLKDYGFELFPLIEHLIKMSLIEVKKLQSQNTDIFYFMYFPAENKNKKYG
ncbi:nucleotidyltransferase-like protein [Pueribacillus theae]|nr:nucleotidyltransferase-like protein [Pueribacillus theae]